MKTLLTFLAILLFAPLASVGSAKEPYNILMIAVDDLNDWVGVYGGHPHFSKHGYTTISSGKIFHKHETANGSDAGHWAYDVWHDELNRKKLP